jgi:hypothetical protein
MIKVSETLWKKKNNWHKLYPVVAFLYLANNQKVIRTWYTHVYEFHNC